MDNNRSWPFNCSRGCCNQKPKGVSPIMFRNMYKYIYACFYRKSDGFILGCRSAAPLKSTLNYLCTYGCMFVAPGMRSPPGEMLFLWLLMSTDKEEEYRHSYANNNSMALPFKIPMQMIVKWWQGVGHWAAAFASLIKWYKITIGTNDMEQLGSIDWPHCCGHTADSMPVPSLFMAITYALSYEKAIKEDFCSLCLQTICCIFFHVMIVSSEPWAEHCKYSSSSAQKVCICSPLYTFSRLRDWGAVDMTSSPDTENAKWEIKCNSGWVIYSQHASNNWNCCPDTALVPPTPVTTHHHTSTSSPWLQVIDLWSNGCRFVPNETPDWFLRGEKHVKDCRLPRGCPSNQLLFLLL